MIESDKLFIVDYLLLVWSHIMLEIPFIAIVSGASVILIILAIGGVVLYRYNRPSNDGQDKPLVDDGDAPDSESDEAQPKGRGNKSESEKSFTTSNEGHKEETTLEKFRNQFVAICKEGTLEQLDALLILEATAAFLGECGSQGLAEAAVNNRVEIVERLLKIEVIKENAASITEPDAESSSVFERIASKGNWDMVELLLEIGSVSLVAQGILEKTIKSRYFYEEDAQAFADLTEVLKRDVISAHLSDSFKTAAEGLVEKKLAELNTTSDNRDATLEAVNAASVEVPAQALVGDGGEGAAAGPEVAPTVVNPVAAAAIAPAAAAVVPPARQGAESDAAGAAASPTGSDEVRQAFNEV